MVRPVQVDGIWDKKHLAYNKYMASLLPRSMYYRLQKLLRTDVIDLLEECNSVWTAALDIGVAVCGDVRIVYSDLVGYQTSDIRLLWTIIIRP